MEEAHAYEFIENTVGIQSVVSLVNVYNGNVILYNICYLMMYSYRH